MTLDINTLAFISCITFITQFIALFIQYLVNKTSHGVRWWLLGSSLWALGMILMPMVTIKSLEILARVANPLLVLGQIFLYIGILRFLDKKESKWILVSISVVFLFFYYYFMFVSNEISPRSLVIAAALTLISFMIASRLFLNKDRHISGSATFTAIIFAGYGIFSAIRVVILLTSPPMQIYSDQELMLELAFVIPIIVNLLWTFGFIIMLNQRLNAENRQEKDNLQLIFNASPDAVVISRLSDGLIIGVNAGFLSMSGYSRAELIGNTTLKINVWHDLKDRERLLNELRNKGICENIEFVFQRKDESLLTGSISAKIFSIQAIPHIFSVIHDITDRKLAEEAIRESEELYRSILNASPDDITITDLQGKILVVSPAAKKMFGYEPENFSFLDSQLLDYIVPEDQERARANIKSMFKDDYYGPNEYHGVRKDRSTFDIEVNSGLIHDLNGLPVKMVFMVRDISERKQAEQQIQQLLQQLEIEKKAAQLIANTDGLTGLSNRRFFDEALNIEFHRFKRSGSPLSFILLDVDYFKKFNDSYGHLAGDDCLRQIGTTLRRLVGRVTDIVARYGGEEFVAVLTETDADGAAILAERIRKTIEALAIPHSGSDISQYVTVSIGVMTVFPNTLALPEQIFARVDEAMYCAKKGGRNRVFISTESAKLQKPE